MKCFLRNRGLTQLVSAACIMSLLNASYFSLRASGGAPTRQPKPWLKFTGMTTVDDSNHNFTKMLENMSVEERITLAISLQMFPKLKKSDFGQFGLKEYDQYADTSKDASEKLPLRPQTFNDAGPKVIQAAFEAGRLNPDDYITPLQIIKEIIWVSEHSLFYPFMRNTVDYHSLVQWVAQKKGIPAEEVQALPTFELEKKIVEKYFAELWDKLSPEKREQVLNRVEKELGKPIPNKAAIAVMGGGAVLAALGGTVALTGFAFYTTMSVIIYSIGAIFGITFPFAVYTTASSLVALLAGPIGWILAGGLFLGGLIWALWPSVDRTASFIMALHFLKSHAFHEAGQLK